MADAVKVTGLRESVRKLERFGAEVADLKDVMTRVGSVVAVEAKSLAPVRSGRLAASIRTNKAKNSAIVRAGSVGVPYAGPINFGWPKRHISGQHFLERALEAKQHESLIELDRGLAALVRRLGLN